MFSFYPFLCVENACINVEVAKYRFCEMGMRVVDMGLCEVGNEGCKIRVIVPHFVIGAYMKNSNAFGSFANRVVGALLEMGGEKFNSYDQI
ncbi:hypothetical protein VNO78_25638 [Psophocarpus tetragonolobus]|uniref:Uncharacterized protein n=1 Tax=Psophocarpus tetragonolobus TaxID=3891 RepID=A0AAN9S7R7_PSOTE